MTRPEPLYPRRRTTMIVVTLFMVVLTMAGQTAVIVLQDRTINGLKDTVAANDKHRHQDIEDLKSSDMAQQKLLVNALTGALTEIRRLQRLVLRLGGNPGGFTTSSSSSPSTAGGGGGTQPQPASSPRPRPTGSSSPAPKPSPSASHSPRPPPPSPTPTPCILPPPLRCIPVPIVARSVLRHAQRTWT